MSEFGSKACIEKKFESLLTLSSVELLQTWYNKHESEIDRFKTHGSPIVFNTVDGLPVTCFCTQAQKDDLTANYQAKEGDVFLASYPHSDAHWLQGVCKNFLGGKLHTNNALAVWVSCTCMLYVYWLACKQAKAVPWVEISADVSLLSRAS